MNVSNLHVGKIVGGKRVSRYRSGLPECPTCRERAVRGGICAGLEMVVTLMNGEELWQSRFPQLAGGVWQLFNSPGCLGVNLEGTSGFAFVKLYGQPEQLELARRVYGSDGKVYEETPRYVSNDPQRLFLRTKIFSLWDTAGSSNDVMSLAKTTFQHVSDFILPPLRALPEIHDWRTIHARAKQPFHLGL